MSAATPTTTRTPAQGGVVFDPKDYAGLRRRFAAILIDLVVCWIAWIAIVYLWYDIIAPGQAPLFQAWLTWMGFNVLYLVILKASPVRTVGFRLTGIRIVNWKGERPGTLWMLLRFLIWVLGPVNAFIDLVWLSADNHKQTLRDKFARTYVVRNTASPSGPATEKIARYSFLALTLIFLELQSQDS